jgi:hypothetical protein
MVVVTLVFNTLNKLMQDLIPLGYRLSQHLPL